MLNIDQRKRNVLLVILLVFVVGMTIAFAALSTNLNISGMASIPASSWDIHFANGVNNTPSTHTDGTTNKATITGIQFAATSITNFTATLNQPKDEVIYNFDIVNAGSIDAQLDHFSKIVSCNSSKDCDLITITFTCLDAQNNDAMADDFILTKNSRVTCEMNIKYKDITNPGNKPHTQTAVNTTLTASWTWRQVENDTGDSDADDGDGGGGSNNGYPCELTGPYAYDFVGGNSATSKGTCEWSNTLSPDRKSYVRVNTTTGVQEVCVKLSGGTVCLNSTNARDFSMASEFESKGATCIQQHWNYANGWNTLTCVEGTGNDAVGCVLYDSTFETYCAENSIDGHWNIMDDGTTSGHNEFGESDYNCTITGKYGYDYVGGNSATNTGATCGWDGTLSPYAKAYARYNISTGKQSICVKLSGGTVCIGEGTIRDNSTTINAKIQEFESKGATCSYQDQSGDYYEIVCSEGEGANKVECDISSNISNLTGDRWYAPTCYYAGDNGELWHLYYAGPSGKLCTPGHCY